MERVCAAAIQHWQSAPAGVLNVGSAKRGRYAECATTEWQELVAEAPEQHSRLLIQCVRAVYAEVVANGSTETSAVPDRWPTTLRVLLRRAVLNRRWAGKKDHMRTTRIGPTYIIRKPADYHVPIAVAIDVAGSVYGFCAATLRPSTDYVP